MSRKITIKVGDNVTEIEKADDEFENYLYRLRLDMDLHNRDYPENLMTVDFGPEQKSLSEQVADGEITEDEAVEMAKNVIRGQRAIALVEIDKQAVIAMYARNELSKSWISYRDEWLQAPNNISTLKDFELWTPPATPVGGL